MTGGSEYSKHYHKSEYNYRSSIKNQYILISIDIGMANMDAMPEPQSSGDPIIGAVGDEFPVGN